MSIVLIPAAVVLINVLDVLILAAVVLINVLDVLIPAAVVLINVLDVLIPAAVVLIPASIISAGIKRNWARNQQLRQESTQLLC